MNRLLVVLVALLVATAVPVFAGGEMPDTAASASCLHCGMNRTTFGHSRMLLTYTDGSSTGLCSLRCLAVELANAIDRTPARIAVADYGTRKLVDAEKATWVLGGGKTGVMTKRAKWAFEKRADAEKFVAENGGSIVSFEQAMKEAYADLYEDTKMIRDKRRMKRVQQGAADK